MTKQKFTFHLKIQRIYPYIIAYHNSFFNVKGSVVFLKFSLDRFIILFRMTIPKNLHSFNM